MVTKIATMRTLQGHRNMLLLHGVFEDEEGFHVVVEYCKGAALLDKIQDRVRQLRRDVQGMLLMHSYHATIRFAQDCIQGWRLSWHCGPGHNHLVVCTCCSIIPATQQPLKVRGAHLLQGHFSEREAAGVMRQLLEFLEYAHDECNVVHRDIKPENLLLLDPDAPQCLQLKADAAADAGSVGVGDMLLKVIDFGTAGWCEPGQHLHSKVGTAR